MSKKETKRTEETSSSSHNKGWCCPKLLLVLSLITLVLVGTMFYQMDMGSETVKNQVYNDGQKVVSKLDMMNEKIDALSNKLDAISITRAGVSGGTGVSVSVNELAAVEKLNIKANKYHVIFLTKEIIEKINNTEDYTDKFNELKSLLGGKFENEMAEIEKYKNMNILTHDEMVKIVEDSTQATKPTTEDEQSAFDNIKSLFKVSGSDEDLKIKCNPIIIDSAIKNLSKKNEWEALKTLEQVEPKNDGLKKVVANLNLRNVLKYYVNLISDETLKNG